MTAFYRNRFSVNAGRTGSRGTYKQSNRVARLYARSMILPPISESMFHLPVPLIEKLLRPVIVYLALVLLLRVFGKRELAQLNPFDLVVLLSLSNTVQNAIIGEDNSVTGGIIGAVSLLTINWVVVRVLFRSPRLNRALEGKAAVLIQDGHVDRKALAREALTREELVEVVHRQGFEHIHDVHRCELEPNGTFYIEGRDPSIADKRHEELLARIEGLVQQVRALQGTGTA
ncbi:MAG TPA: YetF domain-containing protein [Terracidiphilus sp.]|nr:YetF domain-containing protein [Terracidiphilus sp.]